VHSLKTTAGAMLISAAFLAFRPMMPFSSEVQTRQSTQIAREDAACPLNDIDNAAPLESEQLTELA